MIPTKRFAFVNRAKTGTHPQQVRDTGFLRITLQWNEICWSVAPGRGAGKGFAVTFIVHASRGEDVQVTVRLSVAVAIAKGRSLLDEGWQVYITGPDGIRHYPATFHELQAPGPTLRSEP
jgi:hypothetical protein